MVWAKLINLLPASSINCFEVVRTGVILSSSMGHSSRDTRACMKIVYCSPLRISRWIMWILFATPTFLQWLGFRPSVKLGRRNFVCKIPWCGGLETSLPHRYWMTALFWSLLMWLIFQFLYSFFPEELQKNSKLIFELNFQYWKTSNHINPAICLHCQIIDCLLSQQKPEEVQQATYTFLASSAERMNDVSIDSFVRLDKLCFSYPNDFFSWQFSHDYLSGRFIIAWLNFSFAV